LEAFSPDDILGKRRWSLGLPDIEHKEKVMQKARAPGLEGQLRDKE
jgi:hypothetical protein